MSKQSLDQVIQRASTDARFKALLGDNFEGAVRPYDLSAGEKVQLAKGLGLSETAIAHTMAGVDASHVNASHVDATHVNASHVDATHVNASHVDATHVDATHVDATHVDATHVDATHVDATHVDGS